MTPGHRGTGVFPSGAILFAPGPLMKASVQPSGAAHHPLNQAVIHLQPAGPASPASPPEHSTDMEDVIIYSLGALAVRGVRRAVFGRTREERLAQEVLPTGPVSCIGLSCASGDPLSLHTR